MVGKSFNFEPIIGRCVDTLALARAFQNERTLPPNLNKEDFVAWQYRSLMLRDKKTKNSLEALAKLFEIEYDPFKLHDALYDIELNIKIYNKLKYAFEI
jgi:DNA polymerase III epsilon subunit-like protein